MTLLELRDRCNELLAGTCLPHYETGIENLRQSPGTMTLDFDSPLDERVDELEIEKADLMSDVAEMDNELCELKRTISDLRREIDRLNKLLAQ